MARKNLVMSLAKLMIAAAWADQKLSNSEINALKDLLFTIGGISGEDWRELEIYMDSPVGEAEMQALLNSVLNEIRSQRDKALVLETLRNLFEADGEMTAEERELLDEIERSVADVPTGLFAKLSKAILSAVDQRQARLGATGLRENHLEDYVKNTVYYQLKREEETSGVSFDLPEKDLRRICLATGILARVANVDEEMAEEERQAMRRIVAEDWDLTEDQATPVVRIACSRTAKGLDLYRLTQRYFDATTRERRQAFLKTLFRVANACGKTSFEEIEAIRRIGRLLKLEHPDFIAAKMSISREDREGL